VTAEVKKVIRRTDSIDFQDFCPDSGQGFFDGIPRNHVFLVGKHLFKFIVESCFSIDFSTGVQRKGVQLNE
jgi:hypothetical protein